jgi:hypothetical protein
MRHRWVTEDGSVGTEARHLLGEKIDSAVGNECDDLEAIRMTCHDLERAPANRAGRTQDRDPDHGVIPATDTSLTAS